MVPRPVITRLATVFLWGGVMMLTSAQADAPTQSTISFGSTVSDTITNRAIFDIWEFDAIAGEQYRADMAASDGLAPLLGLRDPAGNVDTASNMLDDGSVLDAEPDTSATLFFEITRDGLFALIATRVGRDEGTTTGSYTLTLTRLSVPQAPDNTYVDVVFRCNSDEVTTALIVEFGDQSETGAGYTITAFGLDGFDPVVRLGGDDGSSGALCERSVPAPEDPEISVSLGSDEPLTFYGVSITGAAVYSLAESDTEVRVTVGSKDGRPGRYALRIEGLSIESLGDSDMIVVRAGPFAKAEPIWLWMLRSGLSRLDPDIDVPDEIAFCADVALRTCEPSLIGSGITVRSNQGSVTRTDRLDAVAALNTGTSDPIELTVSSQNGRSTGAYTLWVFGTLPAP